MSAVRPARTYADLSGRADATPVLAAGSTAARTLAARHGETRNVLDFGADPTGTADSRAAIQAALDVFSGLPVSGEIEIPAGNYLLSGPLLLKGMQSYSVRIRGHASSAGPSGSVLTYTGAAGGLCCLEVRGGCDDIVEGITFNANFRAQFGLYLHDDIETTPENPTPRNVSMSNVVVRDVVVTSPLPGDSTAMPSGGVSAGVSLGVGSNGVPSISQCDSIHLDRVKVVSSQDAHAATAGVMVGWGNTKDVVLTTPNLVGGQYGVHWGTTAGASGTLTVIGGQGGGCQTSDFYCQSGTLTVIGYESESSAALLQPGGIVSSAGQITFLGCSWDGNCPDDIFIRANCSLRLVNNRFVNLRTGTSAPRVLMIATGGTTSLFSVMATLVSEGNYFKNATAAGADAGGNPIFSGPSFDDLWLKTDSAAHANASVWARSFGDTGGTEGALTQMRNRGSGTLPNTCRFVTAAYSFVWDDHTAQADCTAGTFPVTLPPLAQTDAGKSYAVVNWGSANAPTVAASGGDAVVGVYSLAARYTAVRFTALKPFGASSAWLATSY